MSNGVLSRIAMSLSRESMPPSFLTSIWRLPDPEHGPDTGFLTIVSIVPEPDPAERRMIKMTMIDELRTGPLLFGLTDDQIERVARHASRISLEAHPSAPT